jgi:hypothetical protein
MKRGIHICRRCHSFIHRRFGPKELGRYYHSKAKLLRAYPIQNYVRWARQRVNES